MFYENSTFLGIPWEIVVKQFRSKHSRERTWLKEYADELRRFLISDELISNDYVDKHFWATAQTVIRDILRKSRARRKESGGGQLSEHCKVIVSETLEVLLKSDFLSPMNEATVEELRTRYGAELGNFVTDGLKRKFDKDCLARGDITEGSLRIEVALREMVGEEWSKYRELERRIKEASKIQDELMRVVTKRKPPDQSWP